MSLLELPINIPEILSPYLPLKDDLVKDKPFVTLTYAQSIDARIAAQKGERTVISHEETKTMTHYLRYHHDGILVGTGTVLADDPGLNCKWGKNCFENSPKPIIIDLKQKWKFTGSKLHQLYLNNQGKNPIVVVANEPINKEEHVEYLTIPTTNGKFDWGLLLNALKTNFNLNSIMVEGGAVVINQLLTESHLINSLIVTIGSTYLGNLGVQVSPPRKVLLENVNWWRGTTDAVMCANLKQLK
ncbi:hypothetical protein Kpol_1053p40 [Vanderwaltozyma polyspora DSM 70294]|uniref:2,5-diamino-6-ribosylamino-4(3H)-pyrimidinone 5'-phosphate reductase n=1 Tax=Vanderwaltozyma polyspora (strain ATCC 22028 / DSM 70294 / BCRC 21397 / CBS 2163 / NBRC 10782 / NRRL Y-8283 / UCD 57-17) TaxID=436907 RepID=A7TN84_VANPO|nr:uncharacterized protein Kpol_1053p40 [Vanderwaltozyma polyspora DSM 70294]EDO16302.1 hypothetical protein Kpol_1053p40 [Vanderwaltozyma polyspora DSM 70294]